MTECLNDQSAMRRALLLARAGLGNCGPNPCVGAVVLDAAGRLVGEGRTEPHSAARAGRHAEVVALAHAADHARGGTVISTLEPCDGTGRTGPCTAALLAAGVARAVYALPDPHQGFAGGGATLAGAGLAVEGGLLSAEAEEIHGPWRTAITRHRPYVTVKLASTLDGRAAAADGTSRWITSAEARADAHVLRARVDAIVVGSGTVLADDPALTVRDTPEPRAPLRVVLDRRGRVPARARVLDEAAPSLLLDTALDQVTKTLYADHGVRHVLVEGGPTLAGAFLAGGLADELVVYLAPAVLGAGVGSLVTDAFPTLGAALRLHLHDVTRVGPDLRITARQREV